jgi:Fe-S cluster biogenesis protein NfuA
MDRKSAEGDVERRIREAIAAMRPLLRIDTVGVELVRFDATTGVAHIAVAGDCPDCDMSAAALLTGIEAHLRRRVPELSAVYAAGAPTSHRDG